MNIPSPLDNRPAPSWISWAAAVAIGLGLCGYGWQTSLHRVTGFQQNVEPAPGDQHVLASGLLAEPLKTVDLPIENISQQTPEWCWVTVAQQIIAASKGRANTPEQCALVEAANDVPAGTCCPNYNQQCVRTGSLQQISGLIAQYGGRTASFAEPTDPMTLYQTLAQGHAVIIALNIQGSGHVVVARGMSTMQVDGGYEPMIILNDPMAQYTQPVPFDQIAPLWQAAIVVN